ncbi:MAG: protein kinase [Candidatus Neomarinimicrobiota bacterium]
MIGQTISHYKILEKLGEGGMGVVYKAEDLKLDRYVALKFLPAHLSSSDEDKQRFIHEAKAASALEHPNIMTIHEIDDAEGEIFIAMEYVKGETLKDKLEKGPLKTKELLNIAIPVAEGLNAAHSKEIIHRDIKSENIMISTEGLVKIMDFGLAKRKGVTRVTKEGSTLGTLAYMSPEQAEGLKVDRRSDLFSFGVVMYEMATGQLPFKGEHDAAVLYAIVNEAPLLVSTLNPNIPEELDRIIHKALEKEAEDRYQHADDLSADLKKLKKDIETGKTAITAAHIPITKESKRKPFYMYAGLAVLVALVILIGIYFFPEQREAIDSIAVLPLKNISGDPEQEYFAEGMTEVLITELSRIKALKVISRTSAMRYKDTDKSLPEIAMELKVGALVEGSVLLAGEQIRITAQLIDAAEDRHLWAEDYERDFRDILSLQKEVARAIAREIAVEMTPQDEARLGEAKAVDPEAFKLYLRGLHFRYMDRWQRAAEFFEQSIAKDPDFAPAYAWLGNSYVLLGAQSKGKKAVAKALELDDSLPEAHVALGLVLELNDWDWAGAEQAFQRAIKLNPGSREAHLEYGLLLARTGKFEEGLAEAKRGVELDPLSAWAHQCVGLVYRHNRQYDQAIESFRMALEIQPNYALAQWRLGEAYAVAYVTKGMYKEAIVEYKKLLVLGRFTPVVLGYLGYAYALSDRREEALKVLDEVMEERRKGGIGLEYGIALIYSGLEERDQALTWLELAYEERLFYLVLIKVDDYFDPLRSDPRFQALLKKMGLEK